MVMPSTPCLVSASFTWSSLNGLMMASIFFIYGPLSGASGARALVGRVLASAVSESSRSGDDAAAASTTDGGEARAPGGRRASCGVPAACSGLGPPHDPKQGACHPDEGNLL